MFYGIKRITYIASLALLIGCASKFGHQITQTIIIVNSKPKGIPYYIISRLEDRRYLYNNTDPLSIQKKNTEYINFLKSKKIKRYAKNSQLVQKTGSKVIIAECNTIYKRYTVLLKKNSTTTLEIDCKGTTL